MVTDYEAAWDPQTDAWLSGFADGEGSFFISVTNRKDGRQSAVPGFAIWLRADDVPVLRALCDAFGGSISFNRRWGGPDWRENARPRFGWQVSGRASLRALVAYFDRFPLHAKKARDYAIWREAVEIYCGQESSRWRRNPARHEAIIALRAQLVASREYDGTEEIAALERSLAEVPDGR